MPSSLLCMDIITMQNAWIFFLCSFSSSLECPSPDPALWKKHQGWAGNQVQYLAQKWYTNYRHTQVHMNSFPFQFHFTIGTGHYKEKYFTETCLWFSGKHLGMLFSSGSILCFLWEVFVKIPWVIEQCGLCKNNWNKQTNNNKTLKTQPTKKSELLIRKYNVKLVRSRMVLVMKLFVITEKNKILSRIFLKTAFQFSRQLPRQFCILAVLNNILDQL